MLICNLHWRCSVLWRTFSSCWTTRWRSTFIACSARTFATHYWGRWNGRGSVTRRAQNEIMMWVFERWENGGCDKRMINVTSLKAIFYVLSLNDIPVKAIGLITIQLSFASVIVFAMRRMIKFADSLWLLNSHGDQTLIDCYMTIARFACVSADFRGKKW